MFGKVGERPARRPVVWALRWCSRGRGVYERVDTGPGGAYGRGMCRNITTLRGLEPSATPDEIEAAARQYVRKVSGVQKTSDATAEPFERAVAIVTAATRELLAELPPRKVPPKTEPPLRRIARARAVR